MTRRFDNLGSAQISSDQFATLQKEAERYKAAQRQVADAWGVLWNAQYDVAVATADASLIERVMRGPLGLWDDCSCC